MRLLKDRSGSASSAPVLPLRLSVPDIAVAEDEEDEDDEAKDDLLEDEASLLLPSRVAWIVLA